MDLEKLTRSGVETAFTLLSSVVVLGTYHRVQANKNSLDYDPAADVIPNAAIPVRRVRMIRAAASEEEVGDSVTINDVKILMPGKDLGFVPGNTADHLDFAGTRYDVIRFKPLAVTSLLIAYCRAK